jgi:signal transduction histidine kinase
MTTTTMMTTVTTTTEQAPPPIEAPPPLEASAALRPPTTRPWRIVVVAVAGLLVGIAVACVAALAITLNVGDVVNRALRHIEVEDEAGDLRAAVLELRHYHRNLAFTGPTRGGLAEFDNAYAMLREEVDELGRLQIDAPGVAQPAQLADMAAAYYTAYRPAVELHGTDEAAFDAANDNGLAALAQIEDEAQELDDWGDALAAGAFGNVEQATSTATLLLLIVLAGVGAVGLGLAVVAFRVLRELRALDATQKAVAGELAQALRARNDFIADASHELRTPLTVLRGNAEVGLATDPADCGHEPILKDIVAESERMTRLVEDLLLLARFDAGSVPLEPRDVDLEPWLAELAARAEMLARKRDVELVPDLLAVGRARFDPGRLEQAVLVLLDNATRYSPPGGQVRLEAATRGGTLVIAVRDRGPGIPADVLPSIFERFYRGDRSRGELRTGAGLGLSIARAVVTAHGGDIHAASQIGKGTTMTMTLPIVP